VTAAAAFNGPSPKTPSKCKNLADISYTNRVIENFVPNFVAMAMEVNININATVIRPTPKTIP